MVDRARPFEGKGGRGRTSELWALKSRLVVHLRLGFPTEEISEHRCTRSRFSIKEGGVRGLLWRLSVVLLWKHYSLVWPKDMVRKSAIAARTGGCEAWAHRKSLGLVLQKGVRGRKELMEIGKG